MQFRENLAPDDGPIRNDNRVGSITTFNNMRFTDAAGFNRWSRGGNRWLDAFYPRNNIDYSILEIAAAILKSKRGIIVTGNLRSSELDGNGQDQLSSTISYFAQVVGMPIVAGVQSGPLRREYQSIPYAEHVLKNPVVSKGLRPDFILQLGSPLISTEISSIITKSIKQEASTKHVLVQQLHPYERADPDQTVTHRVSSNICSFLNALTDHLENLGPKATNLGSELAPLLYLGRKLQDKMPQIILEASSNKEDKADDTSLIEPQIMLAVSEVLAESIIDNLSMSLFLSNSMPVRDGEFFLYPPKTLSSASTKQTPITQFPLSVSVNRGASGIDGILSTAIGCSDSSNPVTLVCGDVTTLHDLNALYGLTSGSSSKSQAMSNNNRLPLTMVVVNNGGGAIFSFLPIAKHGQDVGFEELWGTPTDNFSFELGASAFGLPCRSVSSFEEFKDAYRLSILSGKPSIIEANVVTRSTNVDVHQQITCGAIKAVDDALDRDSLQEPIAMKLPIKHYFNRESDPTSTSTSMTPKTLLLLHGWMGDKSEWDIVAESLRSDLSEEWDIVAIDLPGHGDSPFIYSSDQQMARASLGISNAALTEGSPFTLDEMAQHVCQSLCRDHNIRSIDGIAGYSLGGRVALAMKRLCSPKLDEDSSLMTDNTRLILLGSNPGVLPSESGSIDKGDKDGDSQRLAKDVSLAKSLISSSHRSHLLSESQDTEYLSQFLTKWYGVKALWGDLRGRDSQKYDDMLKKRLRSLGSRRQDIAAVLRGCSSSLTSRDDWKTVVPANTLFVAGELDKKYSGIGRRWEEARGISKYIEVPNAGHALLVEDPKRIASIICGFLNDDIVNNPSLEPESIIMLDAAKSQRKTTTTQRQSHLASSRSHKVGLMEYESFSISIGSNDGSDKKGVIGIGWGDSARAGSLTRREGFIISIASSDGMAVGVGEVSPLKGLHKESIEEAERQLRLIKAFLSSASYDGSFFAKELLSLDGSLSTFVNQITTSAGISKASSAASVKSGLEMALLSVSSQLCGTALPQSLATNYWYRDESRSVPSSSFGQLAINGLITRGSNAMDQRVKTVSFPSIKVKVGHENPKEDAFILIDLMEQPLDKSQKVGLRKVGLRADANRAWSLESAQVFVDEIRRADRSTLYAIEFVEEPLTKQAATEEWTLELQVTALEEFTRSGGPRYALDESLADLAEACGYDFDQISLALRSTFGQQEKLRSGCAAFVLKPALLGLELSMQIAKLAQQEFQINAVFSSSFDSGIGLAYTSILAAVSDNSPFGTDLVKYPHGLGTFTMLCGDTLSPSFESYVNADGMLNVVSLSRALYGLSLDEMSDRLPVYDEVDSSTNESAIASVESESYLAKTSSTSGRDITVAVSLPLPFSDGIASSRFTDLPQMSRWSPWLNSVTYLDTAGLTEWNLNIRGVRFSWKAQSQVLSKPKGIKWESISGLKNRGVVEFEPTSNDSCIMQLKMSIIMPYILVSLFQGMPSVVQDFLQNKLLKWSLEMFRDVVKADLALERGDNELGDALFGAVEGRANALEEALK